MSNGMTVFRRGNSLPHCVQEMALTSSDKKHTFSGRLLWWIFVNGLTGPEAELLLSDLGGSLAFLCVPLFPCCTFYRNKKASPWLLRSAQSNSNIFNMLFQYVNSLCNAKQDWQVICKLRDLCVQCTHTSPFYCWHQQQDIFLAWDQMRLLAFYEQSLGCLAVAPLPLLWF